jgi:subtilisin family serine protease
VAYIGPAPQRSANVSGRRPVVAILDSGCVAHPWLTAAVDETVTLDGQPIGHTDPMTDPEEHPDQSGPLDGGIDTYAGHGTFIAGLIHQACPDADILSWRITPSAGPILESDIIDSLSDIAELACRHREGKPGGHPIDVLSLSFSYYHETPEDEIFDAKIYEPLRRLGEHGVAVICSAGNDSTTRPTFPAALAPWKNGGGRVQPEPDVVPIVSVGALNPNGSDALFSNAGDWVRAHTPGAALLSTSPPFQGGYQAMAQATADGRVRQSIDPDDFRNGFALWSGTSFSAPLFAGWLVAHMGTIDPAHDDSASAVTRMWKSLAAGTDLEVPPGV